MSLFTGRNLNNFVIKTMLSTSSPAGICEEVNGAINTNETRHIGCRLGSVGRIVRIRLIGSKLRPLSLCEVEVYGGNRFTISLPITFASQSLAMARTNILLIMKPHQSYQTLSDRLSRRLVIQNFSQTYTL